MINEIVVHIIITIVIVLFIILGPKEKQKL